MVVDGRALDAATTNAIAPLGGAVTVGSGSVSKSLATVDTWPKCDFREPGECGKGGSPSEAKKI
jgi:hypothetical protein